MFLVIGGLLVISGMVLNALLSGDADAQNKVSDEISAKYKREIEGNLVYFSELTVSFLRPFFRLKDNMFWPAFVLFLLLKPCLFFLFLLLICLVTFINIF